MNIDMWKTIKRTDSSRSNKLINIINNVKANLQIIHGKQCTLFINAITLI